MVAEGVIVQMEVVTGKLISRDPPVRMVPEERFFEICCRMYYGLAIGYVNPVCLT